MIEQVLAYGYWVVALGLIIDAIGFPFPGDVLLLTAGYLVFKGNIRLEIVLPLAIFAAVAGDTLMFSFGRYLYKSRGKNLVSLYCKWTSCVFASKACHEKAERFLARYQGRAIILGKFVWGAREFIPPLAGMSNMRYLRYVILDLLGVTIWVLVFVPLGLLLGDQFENFASNSETLSSLVGVAVVGGLLVVLAWKYLKRRRFGKYREREASLYLGDHLAANRAVDQKKSTAVDDTFRNS